MIKFIKTRILYLSLIVSILIHISFFACMHMIYESNTGIRKEDPSLFYKAALEYIISPPKSPPMEKKSPEKSIPGSNEKPDNKPQKSTTTNKKKPDQEKPEEIQTTDNTLTEETDPHPPGPPENDTLSGTFQDIKDDGGNNTIAADYREEQNLDKKKEIIFKELSNKIKKNIIYPPAARRRGIEGMVTILFLIDKQGNLIRSEVSKSSGYSILDNAAIELIKRVLPYPHTIGKPVEMKISVVYDLS